MLFKLLDFIYTSVHLESNLEFIHFEYSLALL